MGRNIRVLHNVAPPTTPEEIAAASLVDDLAAQRQAILDHGGQAREPWSWAGSDFCECADVEGNAVQVVRRPAAAGASGT